MGVPQINIRYTTLNIRKAATVAEVGFIFVLDEENALSVIRAGIGNRQKAELFHCLIHPVRGFGIVLLCRYKFVLRDFQVIRTIQRDRRRKRTYSFRFNQIGLFQSIELTRIRSSDFENRILALACATMSVRKYRI